MSSRAVHRFAADSTGAPGQRATHGACCCAVTFAASRAASCCSVSPEREVSERASEVERLPLSSTAASTSGMRTLRSDFVPSAQQQSAVSHAGQVFCCVAARARHCQAASCTLRRQSCQSGSDLAATEQVLHAVLTACLASCNLMVAGCEPCCCDLLLRCCESVSCGDRLRQEEGPHMHLASTSGKFRLADRLIDCWSLLTHPLQVRLPVRGYCPCGCQCVAACPAARQIL